MLLLSPRKTILAAVFPSARHVVLGILFCLGSALTATAAPWADLPSDLAPDPAVRMGTLPNGLRYAIRPNAEPNRGFLFIAEPSPTQDGVGKYFWDAK